ncbi:hypothetical protein DDB_G0282455 [Dictyostelium discoideum AX4]|uniref:Uncharacterized protein n=1 Tax=Dictyostelium discoideum TaxID=44689 RepID=Q54SI0_DICDI|nr:hypothetical protein DDB_G0282455 [Dictyostelium discoideum AX4]EAL66087.1 hypothetical protein DDB_G0282455 [Dictyostelium discoideum AX4]|eukprot:XP_640059.1 hypothetical protein DDB_G0282455 [Dictyostelium discoideum AX4]
MLKFLIAILVIFSLLSNLNAVNADKYNCVSKCAFADPNYYKLCAFGTNGKACREIEERCVKGCPDH